MTPELVEFYRCLLLVGLGEGFYRAFDEALEREDPLSDLTLSLCTCISDEGAVLHILREYTLDHPFDEQAVCDLILTDIRSRYISGEMSRVQVAKTLYRIVAAIDKLWDDPWNSLMDLSYHLEAWEDGLICEEVFNQCFDSWFLEGKSRNAWALQKTYNKK